MGDGDGTEATRRSAWASHQIGARLTNALSERLGARAILAVKGLVTAHTLYADVADRPLADADLRVIPDDLASVRLAAAALGLEEIHVHASYGAVLLRGQGFDVDVETSVGPPWLVRLSVADLLAWSRPGQKIGLACRVPDDTGHALVIAVNLFKDKLRLGAPWAREDALRIGAAPGFAPEAIAARAREHEMVTLVGIVAHFLAEEGSAGWRQVAQVLGRPRRRGYAAACRVLFERAPEHLATRLLARCAPDATYDRARALLAAAAFAAELRRAHTRTAG